MVRAKPKADAEIQEAAEQARHRRVAKPRLERHDKQRHAETKERRSGRGWPSIGPRSRWTRTTTVATNTARASTTRHTSHRHGYYISASSASPTVRTPTISKSFGASLWRQTAVGHHTPREPELSRLADAKRRLRGRPHLAGQPDLAKHDDVGRNRPVAQARRDGRDDGEVGRRLFDAHPAGDVHEDVVGRQVEAGALVEHREQQRQAVVIEAARRSRALPNVDALTSACTSTRIGRDPSMVHSTDEPGTLFGRSARNSCEGFATGSRPASGHLEHAELIGGAEPVLDGAHDAVRVMLLRPRSTAPCRRRARAPSARRGCRPSSRGRRESSADSGPSP